MHKSVKLIFTLVLMVVALTAFKCSSSVPDAVKLAARGPNGAVVISQKVQQVTPKGLTVYGETAISQTQLAGADEGIDRLDAEAATDGFKATKPHTFFDVYTPPYQCTPSPIQRIPSFLVHADPYDGTEFDQYNSKGVGVKDGVGVIYAAEMVLSLGTPGSNILRGQMYVCPDLPVFPEAVKNGGEHIHLANYPYDGKNNTDPRYNDGYAYYWCTEYHYTISHPLLPRDGRCLSGSFVSRAKEQPTSIGKASIVGGYNVRVGEVILPTR